MSGAKILIVEDESLIAEEIAMLLAQMGHEASAIVDNAEDAFACARIVKPDMALVDVQIKGSMGGIEIARRFREEFDLPVVFLTAHADPATLQGATATEPFGYIVKPFDRHSLGATLATALRRRCAEEKVAKMERWLSATMNSIGDGVIATDTDFRVTFINAVAQRLCGWPEGSALGERAQDVLRITGPGRPGLAQAIAEATTARIVINLDQCELVSRDGTTVAIDDSLAPIRDACGRVSGVVIVFRDATDRKRHEAELQRLNCGLEEQVRRRTAQLEAANRELAAFSYSIAHDLRAPLRAINGFATLAVQNYGDGLGEEGRRLLDIVTNRASQMSAMIDDYLRLSGLSQVEIRHQPLDMAQLVQAAWSTATAGVAMPPELRLGELPAAHGDATLIGQVWTNLLSNAVKFTRTVAKPVVSVSGRDEGAVVRYCVTDNGVGFDSAHASRLFRVFERLHSQAQFEGNGIGLCIVQRIMHRHEGDVSIRAEPGKGATVEFWMPKRDGATPQHRALAAAAKQVGQRR